MKPFSQTSPGGVRKPSAISSWWQGLLNKGCDIIILYRPVGEKELALIRESGFTAFPPRLRSQPIFYPVLNQRYAEEIAQRWNTTDANSGYKGYVTCFEVEDAYIRDFEVQTVGASYHQEYWIPAEKLAEFNRHILGAIEVIREF